MKLSQLRNLVAVAEAGSVRQASRNLNISQSAVTKSIKQLEADLGVQLLHRASHGVSPTSAGEALILRARVVESELREARNDVETVQGGVSGSIRVSASPSVATGLLPRTIVGFRRTRPNVSIQIEEAVYPEQLPDLRNGNLDFAICLVPERLNDDGLDFEVLLKDRLTPPARTIYCASFVCALKLVESSDCVTLVPKHLFSSRATLAGIVPLHMDTQMPSWNVAVISRSAHTLSPLCRNFLAEIKKTAAAFS